MFKRGVFLRVIGLLLVMALSSCAGAFRPSPKEVGLNELKLHYQKGHLSLTPEQKARVEVLLGRHLRYYAQGCEYFCEKETKKIGRAKIHLGEREEIFPIYQKTPYGQLVMLVWIDGNDIDKIAVVKNVLKDHKPLVTDAFLNQFVGKALPKLLTNQGNIKPIAGEPAISQEIAERLQELLAIYDIIEF